MVAKWGVEAGFGGPVRSLRPLRWAYGPKKPLPEAPAEGGALGEGLKGPYAHRRCQAGPPKPASTPHFATTHFAPPGKLRDNSAELWCTPQLG